MTQLTSAITKDLAAGSIQYEAFKKFCQHQHDVVCNQTYAKALPYSMHLMFVEKQANKFLHLVPAEKHSLVRMGCWGHDLIEDARVSYNDIIQETHDNELAEIIFLCTEMRGRDRAERKNEQFYDQLSKNRLATFVKLCDVIANIKYSILENSRMLKRYQEEFEKVRVHLWGKDYDEIFIYINRLLNVDAPITV